MIQSHSLVYDDFKTAWYKKWARQLKQDAKHLDNHDLLANKFWQNAILFEALSERGVVKKGSKVLGFGVGQERLPALFAKYKVNVTATDQDFTTQKAGHWSQHELARGTQSLNRLKICDAELFSEMVEYMPVDMNKVPQKLHDTYDALWSNCALGHLGSIPNSVTFIKESLKCLKPGGWAVHTTELNLLSNADTVDSGSTILFRLKDIYKLQCDLVDLGYIPAPFKFTPGKTSWDHRISMRPQFGNDYSKIQVMGHFATQVLLIVHRPQKLSALRKVHLKAQLKKSYIKNLTVLSSYKKTSPVLRKILASQKASHKKILLKPERSVVKLRVEKGKKREVTLTYKNDSSTPLFSTYARHKDSKPIALATTKPNDRDSKAADISWESKNRPAKDIWVRDPQTNKYVLADHVAPGQDFAFKFTLTTSKLKKGLHHESFSVVQELSGWVENSEVQLDLTII